MKYFQGSLPILKYVQQELLSPTYVDRPCSVVSLPAFYILLITLETKKPPACTMYDPNQYPTDSFHPANVWSLTSL